MNVHESEIERLKRRVAELEASLPLEGFVADLHAMFDGMFEGVQVVDKDYRYLYVNASAASHGQRARDELVGQRMVDMYPGIEQTEMFQLLRVCMSERRPGQMLNNFVYPNGGNAWFDLRMHPVPAGVLILSVDISPQKHLEEELRRSRENLVTTLSCMAEGVITTDVASCVTSMNPSAEAITGWSMAEAEGQSLDDLVLFLNQRTGEPVPNTFGRVLNGGLAIGLGNDTVMVTRNGTQIPIASSGAPLRDARGSIRGVVIVMRNMKEEYELTSMLQRAEKVHALGTLAGGVAHDFNNLLTVISGYSDLLLADLGPDHPSREAVVEIREAGERSARLTRQLLTFSRQPMAEPRVVDINEILAGVSGMLARVIGEDITMTTNADTKGATVRADPGQLEQLILNLVVNARDAMPKGGDLTIETGIENVSPEVAVPGEVPPGRYVLLEVADSGVGMDEVTRSRVFEPFFTTKEERGTGLGLASVKSIANQNGGYVSVTSRVGKGSSFRVLLPEVSTAGVTSPGEETEGSVGGSETVLVVEDEDSVRAVVARILTREGYTVLEASSGQAAIHKSQEYDGSIDLLISDIVMPGVSAGEVVDTVLVQRPKVKVLLLSGYSPEMTEGRGVALGDVALLRKPFTVDALARKVRHVLDGIVMLES